MNELDEVTGPVNEQGRDTAVIEKQLPITVGFWTKFLNVFLWFLPLPIISGIIWAIVKVNAGKYFSQLQQKIQQAASQVDNYLEQRVIILQNVAKLLDKSIALDKDTFVAIAEARSGGLKGTNGFTEANVELDKIFKQINVALEAYPDLKAHNEIKDAMQQNSYTQREITAAREHYNDVVAEWNRALYEWPAKQYVAYKKGYTTRIPFSASKEMKEAAKKTFF